MPFFHIESNRKDLSIYDRFIHLHGWRRCSTKISNSYILIWQNFKYHRIGMLFCLYILINTFTELSDTCHFERAIFFVVFDRMFISTSSFESNVHVPVLSTCLPSVSQKCTAIYYYCILLRKRSSIEKKSCRQYLQIWLLHCGDNRCSISFPIKLRKVPKVISKCIQSTWHMLYTHGWTIKLYRQCPYGLNIKNEKLMILY